MLLIYELTLLALILIPFLYHRVIKEESWESTIKELLPFNKNIKKEVIGSIALFILLFIGFITIALSFTITHSITGINFNDLDKVENIILQEINNSFFGFILLIIFVLFIEELFFRAFLIEKIGIFGSTLIFTIFHLGYGSIAQVIGVFFLGLILAYWFKKNKSIIQNYIGHLLYDFLAIALYILF